MRNFTFPSIENPNCRYRWWRSVDDNAGYNWRNQNVISSHLSFYDTMGDGEVQHSPDVCPSKSMTRDLLNSFGAALHTIEFNEDNLDFWNTFIPYSTISDGLIRFAATVKHKENKRQWFSLNEEKVSSADSKRYDKRWEEVNEFHDGSFGSIVRILHSEMNFSCVFRFLRCLLRIRELTGDTWGSAKFAEEWFENQGCPMESIEVWDRVEVIDTYFTSWRHHVFAVNASKRILTECSKQVAV